MSAGGISYSGITNHGKVTLPSVEMGLGTMNVLKDPPKSIMTRRIQKVGENNDLLEDIYDSGDCISEAITHYARGVNPMIEVSFTNHGGNGTGNGSFSNTQQAKLPRTLDNYHFRPPSRLKDSSIAFSRMPRLWTTVNTSKDFPKYSRRIVQEKTAEKTKETKDSILKVKAKPSKVYIMQSSAVEPSNTKTHINKNVIKVQAQSGMRTIDKQYLKVSKPTGSTQEIIKGNISTNLSNPLRKNGKNNKQTYQNIKKTFVVKYNTQKTRAGDNINYIHNDIEKNPNMPHYKATTNKCQKGIDKNTISRHVARERNIPLTTMTTNIGTSGRGFLDISKAQYKLPERLSCGGFSNNGHIITPKVNENANINLNNSNKLLLKQRVIEQRV